MKRKAISKKTRFEVFKRDSFTCQYCGKSAPDVILEIDHIIPVSNDGDHDIFNFLTACEECNRGKGKRQLDDDTVVQKQRKQLDIINSKREQLKLIAQWKKELRNYDDKELEEAEKFYSQIFKYSLNEYGKRSLKKLIKKFGIKTVLEAIDTADQYLKYEWDENTPTRESAEYAFNKIGGICYYSSMEPEKKEIEIIKLRMRKKYYGYKPWEVNQLVDACVLKGWKKDDFEELMKKCQYKSHVENYVYGDSNA